MLSVIEISAYLIIIIIIIIIITIMTHNRLTALFRDYPGKPVPER